MHVWVGACHIIAERDSERGWGREKVSTQHEFWPAVAGKGAKLVHGAAMNVSAQGGFLLCLEARAVPRHIFHLHTLKSLGGARGCLAWAHWTFFFFLTEVGRSPGCVSAPHVCSHGENSGLFPLLGRANFSSVSVFSKNQSHCFAVISLVWEQPDHCMGCSNSGITLISEI